MAASLPSYHEAITRLDWLQPVAPYVRFADYRALCLVSRRFWAVFAPRLWTNLLRSARLSGLQSGDGKYCRKATLPPAPVFDRLSLAAAAAGVKQVTCHDASCGKLVAGNSNSTQ